ncbi:MAG: hypothetical protein A2351_01450 [Omnitrophica bacterium RIFOXYB12_FULL_50_7]|nr:MAG: hypothetical protein A2351_01450 [Omnitrophica bacterium RIFOXYB12_FULL_50_7]
MSEKNDKQSRRKAKLKTERAFFNEIKKKGREVNLLKAVQILDKTITASLCETVFQTTRTQERQRVWTLHALVQFWNAVIVNAPTSLRQALEEAAGGQSPQWPEVETTAEAFFQRSQDLSWRFFEALYESYQNRIEKIAPPCFAQELAHVRSRFPEIRIVDASSLDAIVHRLKILRHEEGTILPGRIMAAYDLFRGHAASFRFSENAMESEIKQFGEILPQIPRGALVVADRLYGVAKAFGLLSPRGLYGLFRRHGSLSMRKIRRLNRKHLSDGVLEDWLVEAGTGQKGTEKQILRWVVLRRKKQGAYELLTNVLDPEQLSAEDALELYSQRWDIERLFYDLKEVLHLHRFYAGNVNAVGMQVYAAVIVHTAMRLAQGRIAQQNGMAPEKISIEKFFPRMAAALCRRHMMKFGAQMIKDSNPGVRLREPNWDRIKAGTVKLYQILVEPRQEGPPRKDTRVAKKKRNCISLHKLMSYSEN